MPQTPRSVREQVGIDLSPEEIAAQQAAAAEAQAQAQSESDRPAWLPEQFETPEAFAEHFRSVESERGRLASEVGTLRDQVAELAVQREQPQQQQQFQGADPLAQLAAAYEQAYEVGDARAMFAIQQTMIQAHQQAAIQTMQQMFDERQQPVSQQNDELMAAMAEGQVAPVYGDRWQQMRAEVGQVIDEYGLVQQGMPLDAMVKGLHLAAEIVSGRQGTAAGAGQPSLVREKQLAQTANGSGARVQQTLDPADALLESFKSLGQQGYR